MLLLQNTKICSSYQQMKLDAKIGTQRKKKKEKPNKMVYLK